MGEAQETEKTDTIFVLARNIADAKAYAHKRRFGFSRMVYVTRVSKMKSISGKALHVVNGAQNRGDYSRLLEEARKHNIQIRLVECP